MTLYKGNRSTYWQLPILCSLTLGASVTAAQTNLLKEVYELKPRCEQMMRDIRDEKVDDIIKGYHPMMQQWQDGKRARKWANLSINGYKRKADGVELLDFLIFKPESSGFLEMSKNLKGNYPNAKRALSINYSFKFKMRNGQDHIGSARCVLFEENGQWYFEDDLPF
ncbi:hypothetical protein L1D29_08590 [Shewanella insulae]|uniref:hypothetical protein n=1 Tax=Shewanella insulae TaxID=2681496 RepID=UPI001EFC94EE|nr:hypothetical protein [Shewanella insulae]MCG9712872.1 hypothetical protein [Shewanella insulae]